VSNRELAEAYGLNRHTVAKWRQREETADASHRPHRLHVTLSAAQEAVVELCGSKIRSQSQIRPYPRMLP